MNSANSANSANSVNSVRSRGVWIDIAFIVLSVFVLPRIGYRLQQLFELSFRQDDTAFYIIGSVVVVVFLWRWIALYLKRFAFERRNETTERNIGVFWFAYFPSAVLSFAFFATLIAGLVKEANITDLMEGEAFIGLSALFFLGIEAWLMYRLNPRIEMEFSEDDWRFEPLTEVFADIGLFAYIFVWQCFYNLLVATVKPRPSDTLENYVGIFIFALIVFLFFYLGPRLLFLMEDGRRPATWIRIGLIFVISFVAHLFFF